MPGRLRLVALILACTFALSVTAVEAASRHAYPQSAKSAFLRGCTKGGASRTLCNRALSCIQRRLTYRQFVAAGVAIGRHRTTSGTRTVRSCGRSAVTG